MLWPRSSNRLLASLPSRAQEQVADQVVVERLALRQELSQPDVAIDRAYFPISGVVSLISMTEDGESIEALPIGNEGVVGFWMALGMLTAPWRSGVELEGEALVMAPDAFMAMLNTEADFQAAVLEYCGAALVAASQSTLCNRFHDLTARTARWLLLMHDRTTGDEFRLTHTSMGFKLGVHRPAVTVALRTLVRAGVVEQTARGRLRIVDRVALEDVACECYARARAGR